MKLRRDNPYSTGKVFKFKDETRALLRVRLDIPESPKDRVHVLVEGETLDTLAFKFYKNSKLWWIIADYNNILDPFDLTPYTTLDIPDMDRIKAFFI